MLYTLNTLALTTLVVLAVVWDLRTRRIPNALTVSGVVIALVLRGVAGFEPFVTGLIGGAIALGLSLPLVFLGGLGGGDSKLLAAVGAFLGPSGLPTALFVMALVGGAMALGVIIYRGALFETLSNTWRLVRQLASRGTPEPLRTLATPGAIAVPYGVAIGAGALAGWML